MKWYTKLDVAKERCPNDFQDHPSNFKDTRLNKIVDFDPNLAFPDCNCSLNSPMALKRCTKLEVAQKRYPIVFQGHLSNLKVARGKKLLILTQIWRLRTVASVWSHWWLWNDAQNLKQHRKCALLFFKDSRQISRSHGTKMDDFDANWAFPCCNSSLNSPMALKRCTKLEIA